MVASAESGSDAVSLLTIALEGNEAAGDGVGGDGRSTFSGPPVVRLMGGGSELVSAIDGRGVLIGLAAGGGAKATFLLPVWLRIHQAAPAMTNKVTADETTRAAMTTADDAGGFFACGAVRTKGAEVAV